MNSVHHLKLWVFLGINDQFADIRSIIRHAATVQEATPAEINDPLFKAAGLILSGSGTETDMKTMDTIIPMIIAATTT